jgi:hypothetical protein
VSFQHPPLPKHICAWILHLTPIVAREMSHQDNLISLRRKHQNLFPSPTWCCGNAFARLSKEWKGVLCIHFLFVCEMNVTDNQKFDIARCWTAHMPYLSYYKTTSYIEWSLSHQKTVRRNNFITCSDKFLRYYPLAQKCFFPYLSQWPILVTGHAFQVKLAPVTCSLPFIHHNTLASEIL